MKVSLAVKLNPSELVDMPFIPQAPGRLDDLDIPRSLLEDLILRHAFTKAVTNLRSLNKALKIPISVLMDLFQRMRQRQLFEIVGMEGNDYNFTLSDKGRGFAEKRFYTCQYAGPAPVPVDSYFTAVRKQKGHLSIYKDYLRRSFKDLVLTDRFLDQLGPALVSQKSIFLYGPTGSGKTSIAANLDRIFDDTVFIPYALEYDGQIIVLYDPLVHQKVEFSDCVYDNRWVPCRRPCLVTGGELEPKMLELQIEESTQVYTAPIQLRANNGILVIDDFGRQSMPPHYLLNRWIVPLDRRVDYLSLRYGAKFEIPFEMVVVFSTNLDPNSLADEAFLRRIQNKIFVEAVDPNTFTKIFDRIVAKKHLHAETASSQLLLEYCKKYGPGGLRACYPGDIIDIVISIAGYEGESEKFDSKTLQRAVDLYFTKPQVSDQKH
jgi:MoxR-like ATPase